MVLIDNPIIVGGGGTSLDPLKNPAQEAHVLKDKEFYDDQGTKRVGVMEVESAELDDLVDGTLKSFTPPAGKTKIRTYFAYILTTLATLSLAGIIEIGANAFYGCTGLQTVTLPSTLQIIGNSAFQGCTNLTKLIVDNGVAVLSGTNLFNGCTALTTVELPDTLKTVGAYFLNNCTRVANLVLPKSLTDIGNYAFYSVGSGQTTTFAFESAEECKLGDYAFSKSRLSKIAGKFSSVGSYACQSCPSLSDVDIEAAEIKTYAFQSNSALRNVRVKINGPIGTYAFESNTALTSIEIDPDSIITSLGSYAFRRCGSNRSNADESTRFVFDLRKSTFESVPDYCFGDNSSTASYRNKYMTVRLPASVKTIGGYAFAYNDHLKLYFDGTTPPVPSASSWIQNTSNTSIFVPYDAIDAYRTATNIVTYKAMIKGYAPANAFELGTELPTVNYEGYALTWYSDESCTQTVGTVEDPSAEYYCTASELKVAYRIVKVTTVDCEIDITDETGKRYNLNDQVSTGTVLTITGRATKDGYIKYLFKVNGEDFEEGSTHTMNSDLSVMGLYWDGEKVPVNPVFEDNDWEMIRLAISTGIARDMWEAGACKPLVAKDGHTYQVRLVDLKPNRYQLASGDGYTQGVLEFVELLPDYKTINSTTREGYYTGGGFAKSDMLAYLQTLKESLLPEDFASILTSVKLSEYSYTTPSPREYTTDILLPAETEVFDARHYSAEGSQSGCPKYEQWEYYAAHNTNADRTKKKVNGSSNTYWWLRSPYSGNHTHFCVVGADGSFGDNRYANNSYGVSLAFPIG